MVAKLFLSSSGIYSVRVRVSVPLQSLQFNVTGLNLIKYIFTKLVYFNFYFKL
jgi:hypothetical protein